jgi:hypothetical protein
MSQEHIELMRGVIEASERGEMEKAFRVRTFRRTWLAAWETTSFVKRRGRAAVRSEWRLIAATHNLLKLHRHRFAPAAA